MGVIKTIGIVILKEKRGSGACFYKSFQSKSKLFVTNFSLLFPTASVGCLQGSPGNLVQFEDLLFSNVDLVVGTAVIAVCLTGDPKARVSSFVSNPELNSEAS